ncbi:hypothetical protein EDC04DRAFT_2898474 [Pisolithus marmoratus]|nr:hypothetical protein EDC04DRAFT_2898474 [Pisolithus marmoratus]
MPKQQYEDVLGHALIVPPSRSMSAISESEFWTPENDGALDKACSSALQLSLPQPNARQSSAEKCIQKEADYSVTLSQICLLKATHLQEKDKLQRQLWAIQQSAQAELEEHKARVAALEKIMNERETIYQQECKKLHEQIGVNREAAASLERMMNERETECAKLHQQIRVNHETATSQHKNDMENLCNQFEVEMNNWVEKLTASSHLNLTNAMEQCDRELDEKVCNIKESMQAAKECELANLDQRYACRECQATIRSPTCVVSLPHSNPDVDGQPATSSQRQSKVAPNHSTVTPNLDAIKRLNKSRRFSCRAHLVGVQVEENEPDIPHMSTAERETPVPPSHDNDQVPPSQVLAMVDAVTKGVEATLKNVFGNSQALPNLKHTPCRSKETPSIRTRTNSTNIPQKNEVRKLFKEKFGFTHDTEFIAYDSADPSDVHAYEYEDGPGPDVNSPVFDLMHGPSSVWNIAVIDNLLQALQAECNNENWPVHQSDAYLRTLIVDRYKRLRTMWRKAQPKLMAKGILETPAETETRLVAEWNALLKANHQTMHCRNKYYRWLAVVEYLVKLKMEENEDDIDAWKWLKDLLACLGEHGMSSEESGVENDVEIVLCVKNLTWHCSVERELDLIDLQRLLDEDIFTPQGSQPL